MLQSRLVIFELIKSSANKASIKFERAYYEMDPSDKLSYHKPFSSATADYINTLQPSELSKITLNEFTTLLQGIQNLEQDEMKEILKLGFDKAIGYLPKYLQSKTQHGDMN